MSENGVVERKAMIRKKDIVKLMDLAKANDIPFLIAEDPDNTMLSNVTKGLEYGAAIAMSEPVKEFIGLVKFLTKKEEPEEDIDLE